MAYAESSFFREVKGLLEVSSAKPTEHIRTNEPDYFDKYCDTTEEASSKV